MSKLDEKQVEQAHKSAAVQKDKAFEEWVSQSVLDETAEMVNGLENDPDLDDFEPSEELFQKIVGIANERGLLAEEETAEEETDDVRVKKIEFSDDKIQENPISIADINNEKSNRTLCYYSSRKRVAVKWVAMLAVTLLGIFGVSMSSQANRTFVMQKVDSILGNDINTKINNTTDIVESDTKEEDDRKKIEDTLNVKVPILFYMLDGMEYDSFSIDEKAKTACIRYKYEDKYLYLQIFSNSNGASGIMKNDKGELVDTLSSDWVDINVELWKIEEEGDEMPTYLAQWEYNNVYYNINAKINEQEMEEIVSDIIY